MSFQENAFCKSSKILILGMREEYFIEYIIIVLPTLNTNFCCKLVRLRPKMYEFSGFQQIIIFFQNILCFLKVLNILMFIQIERDHFFTYVHLLLILNIMKLNWYYFCKISLHYCFMFAMITIGFSSS